MSRRTWQWTKNLFFYPLDLILLNCFIILASCGSKLSHWQFRLTLVRKLLQEVGMFPQSQTTRQEWQTPSDSQLKILDTRHWPLECNRIWCHLCSAKSKETSTKFKCPQCSTGFCDGLHFGVYHTKLHFWGPADIKLKSGECRCN